MYPRVIYKELTNRHVCNRLDQKKKIKEKERDEGWREKYKTEVIPVIITTITNLKVHKLKVCRVQCETLRKDHRHYFGLRDDFYCYQYIYLKLTLKIIIKKRNPLFSLVNPKQFLLYLTFNFSSSENVLFIRNTLVLDLFSFSIRSKKLLLSESVRLNISKVLQKHRERERKGQEV